MYHKIRFNPNNPNWQQWEYIYGIEIRKIDVPENMDVSYGEKAGFNVSNYVEKRIVAQTKEELKERVTARGFEWDDSKIEYISKKKKNRKRNIGM